MKLILIAEDLINRITWSRGHGQIIKQLRKQQGVSQVQLAKRIGISRQLLSDIEWGRNHQSLLFSTFQSIAEGLEIGPASLLNEFQNKF
jgi:transcriptional regulator with XRE-family HTH domain